MALPMFPLGTVLFPHARLPLHVFEHRYQVLVERCLEGDREFGVVLIERGSEVGGGDVRSSLGTVARITGVTPLPEGRLHLETVGARRVRVTRWLDDDPHPWAEVETLDEPAADPDDRELRDRAERRLREILSAVARREGEELPPFELHPDPAVASHQAAALTPSGPLDAQRLLAAETHGERLRAVLTTLDDLEELLRFGEDGADA